MPTSGRLIISTVILFITHFNAFVMGLLIHVLKIEIKNVPSALLSYISTQDFLRTREKC